MRSAPKKFLIIISIVIATIVVTGIYLSAHEKAFRNSTAFPKNIPIQSHPQPNIIVVMVDDLEVDLTNRLFENGFLPNIKKYIADEGTTFKNSFVTTSLCCPDRATFLTGQYSHNHKVLSNDPPLGSVTKLADSNTLVTWLKKVGYTTGLVGKYLNRYGNDPTTPITNPLNPAYVPPGWDYWRVFLNNKMYNYEVSFNGKVSSYGAATDDYQTDVIARLSAEFIEQTEANDGMPFFLWVTPHSPHIGKEVTLIGCKRFKESVTPAPRHAGSLSSWTLPRSPSFNELFMEDKPSFLANYPLLTTMEITCLEEAYRARATAMRSVDDLVGTIANALVKNGEWENTVLIFTSDNGYYNGEHRLFGKVIQYEEGIRVPLYIKAPEVNSNQSTNRFALSNDLAPTIAQFAGLTPELPVDGRSLTPIMQDTATSKWRKRFLVEFLGSFPKEKMAQYDLKETQLAAGTPNFWGVRTDILDEVAPNQFLNVYADGSKEYYDLNTDPYQLDNRLYKSTSTIPSKKLEEYLAKLKDCSNGHCQMYEDE